MRTDSGPWIRHHRIDTVDANSTHGTHRRGDKVNDRMEKVCMTFDTVDADGEDRGDGRQSRHGKCKET